MVIRKKMFSDCSRFRNVSLFVNYSAKFVEAIFKSSISFFCVLLVTTVALYHVNDVFRVAVDVMINTSCFTGRIKCIIGKSVRYVVARQTVAVTVKRTAGLVIF